MLTIFTDEYFMKEALKQAKLAYENDEVPVGAVIACDKSGHMFHIFSAYPSKQDIVLLWCTV